MFRELLKLATSSPPQGVRSDVYLQVCYAFIDTGLENEEQYQVPLG